MGVLVGEIYFAMSEVIDMKQKKKGKGKERFTQPFTPSSAFYFYEVF